MSLSLPTCYVTHVLQTAAQQGWTLNSATGVDIEKSYALRKCILYTTLEEKLDISTSKRPQTFLHVTANLKPRNISIILLPTNCNYPLIENHSYMFRLLFTAIFREHQYVLHAIHIVSKHISQILNGKIECQ